MGRGSWRKVTRDRDQTQNGNEPGLSGPARVVRQKGPARAWTRPHRFHLSSSCPRAACGWASWHELKHCTPTSHPLTWLSHCVKRFMVSFQAPCCHSQSLCEKNVSRPYATALLYSNCTLKLWFLFSNQNISQKKTHTWREGQTSRFPIISFHYIPFIT